MSECLDNQPKFSRRFNKITIQLDFPLVLTHRQADQCKCAFVRGVLFDMMSKSVKKKSYLCGERLDWLKVKVVVQMQVVEVLTVDQQIEHVVALSAHLQANLHPVQLGGLEELGGLERTKQVPGGGGKKQYTPVRNVLKTQMAKVYRVFRGSPLLLGLGWSVFESVEHIILEQFLVGHAHFDRLASRAVLTIPVW